MSEKEPTVESLLESNRILLERLERAQKILTHLFTEHSGAYFICGEAGARDSLGLPDKILVCPTYGLDGFCAYKKDGDYSAPGW